MNFSKNQKQQIHDFSPHSAHPEPASVPFFILFNHISIIYVQENQVSSGTSVLTLRTNTSESGAEP